PYTFRATGSVVRFQGFLRVYEEGRDEQTDEESEKQVLPELKEGQPLVLIALVPKQRFTEPPPRYSEATLVKALEEKGIGRPSTYATIISTIRDRGYVVMEEKRFKPTELGRKVNDLLVRYFPDIVDVEFTAGVETKLDGIEKGQHDWVQVLSEFYGPFSLKVSQAVEQAEKITIEPVVTDETCPKCGKPMLLRQGRFGPFLGCSGFPECRTVAPVPEQRLNMACPKEGCPGQIVQKRSRKGRVFYGCTEYPNCDYVTWYKPTNIRCEACGFPMGERSWRGRTMGLECTNKDCPTVAQRTAEKPPEEPPDGSDAGSPDSSQGTSRKAA
ncbi:MAG: DNA topoisomerase, partial [Armatimonadota bacterium]